MHYAVCILIFVILIAIMHKLFFNSKYNFMKFSLFSIKEENKIISYRTIRAPTNQRVAPFLLPKKWVATVCCGLTTVEKCQERNW